MIKSIVFDLCDTLVRTAGVKALLALPGTAFRHDETSLSQWFSSSPVFPAYEKGQATTAEFLEALHGGLGTSASLDQLRCAYQALILCEIEGVPQWLRQLGCEYPLYALSNNNPLLWGSIQRISPALEFFERIFLSQKIGLLKPDPLIFHYLLEQIGCEAEETVLVDDNPACIRGAGALGLHTVHFTGAAHARHQLEQLLGQVQGSV